MAINKYGIENFTFEIIEECSEEQLNNRERYWIAYYDTYHNGYNRTVGGEGLSGEEHPRAILMANPIANTKVKYRGRKVRNINTNQVFTSINSAAKWAKCGATTLTRHLATDKLAGIVPDTNEVAVWEEIF